MKTDLRFRRDLREKEAPVERSAFAASAGSLRGASAVHPTIRVLSRALSVAGPRPMD